MSLRGLLTLLAVPPVNLLIVCFAGLAIQRWRRRAGTAVLVAGLLGLLVLATPLASGLLIASLEGGLPLNPPPGDPPQAIVILSGDVVRGLDPASGVSLTPGELTLEREQAGAALARRTGLPILVTGGLVEDGQDILATIMARSLADDFGVQIRWAEPKAANTWENAAESAAILRAQNIHSVYLVTHAWHMRRALLAFASTGLTVTAAPVRLDPAPSPKPSDFVPRASAWLASYYALHEWIGCLDYAFHEP